MAVADPLARRADLAVGAMMAGAARRPIRRILAILPDWWDVQHSTVAMEGGGAPANGGKVTSLTGVDDGHGLLQQTTSANRPTWDTGLAGQKGAVRLSGGKYFTAPALAKVPGTLVVVGRIDTGGPIVAQASTAGDAALILSL